MKRPYTQLYLHYVWATWDRLPLLTPAVERAVYAAIFGKCEELNCVLLAIGGMMDHVHLLVRPSTTISVANPIQEFKGSSSHLITHEITPGEFFKWQGCYGAFTVSKADAPEVRKYIERQKEHHTQNQVNLDWECVENELTDLVFSSANQL